MNLAHGLQDGIFCSISTPTSKNEPPAPLIVVIPPMILCNSTTSRVLIISARAVSRSHGGVKRGVCNGMCGAVRLKVLLGFLYNAVPNL